MSERYVRDEPQLIRDTTEEELAYIAARAEEASLAEEAGSLGTVEDEAEGDEEEKKFLEWAGPTREISGAGARVPLREEVAEESAKEGSDTDEPSAPKKKRVLRRAGSGEPVRPGSAA